MPDRAPDFSGKRSAALAEQVLAIGPDSLDKRDLAQLQRLLLDHLGCCYRGAHLPWGERMREFARKNAAAGPALLFGEADSLAPVTASFANATAAHGLELDDTHDESVSHPGAAVIATALAFAAQERSTGAETLAAITAGYEVVGRVGAATNAAAIIEKGFHPTSLFAGFGAAAAAASLLKFTPRQLTQTWGLMLSMAGGSMQFSQEAHGTTVKRLHGGLAALHGATAAELAALGIAGPEQALDGRYGLTAIFGRDQALERLVQPHADGPEIHRISFKPYPCCRLFHSTIDALIEVTDDFSTPPESVVRITVGGPEIMVTQHMLTRPESEMAAQYSLPWTLAAAFYHGPRSVDGFAESVLGDTRLFAIADRVTAQVDAVMQEKFPSHFGSWLEIELDDGTRRRSEVLNSRGTPARPLSLDDLAAKFDELTGPTPLGVKASDVCKCLNFLHDAPNIDELIELFQTR